MNISVVQEKLFSWLITLLFANPIHCWNFPSTFYDSLRKSHRHSDRQSLTINITITTQLLIRQAIWYHPRIIPVPFALLLWQESPSSICFLFFGSSFKTQKACLSSETNRVNRIKGKFWLNENNVRTWMRMECRGEYTEKHSTNWS